MAEFTIHDGNVVDAVHWADFYGESVIEQGNAIQYFIMATDLVIHCWPAVRPETTMADFLEHLYKEKL